MSKLSEKELASKLFITHVIREARAASDRLMGSFLVQTEIRKKYIRADILFVCRTERMAVETEVETWRKIYKWIQERTDELFERHGLEKSVMIVLYPRFMNLREFNHIYKLNKERLEKNKIIWYDES